MWIKFYYFKNYQETLLSFFSTNRLQISFCINWYTFPSQRFPKSPVIKNIPMAFSVRVLSYANSCRRIRMIRGGIIFCQSKKHWMAIVEIRVWTGVYVQLRFRRKLNSEKIENCIIIGIEKKNRGSVCIYYSIVDNKRLHATMREINRLVKKLQ